MLVVCSSFLFSGCSSTPRPSGAGTGAGAGAADDELDHLLPAAAPGNISVAESMAIRARAPEQRLMDVAGSQGTNAGRFLPRIQLSQDGRSLANAAGVPFVPFGLTYYRPGTGWAPQVWKKFDAEATRRDFVRMKELGVNCVRVFLSFGSFYSEPGRLDAEAIAKFDEFLLIAEKAGIYVHPTGPDHWEGLPEWARMDRYSDERVLSALEEFWKLFAARYRGRSVIFAYDLLNEPEVPWDTPTMRSGWRTWLKGHYTDTTRMASAWGEATPTSWEDVAVPAGENNLLNRRLLDFQRYRESVAVEWTRRQVRAIRSADPRALVTVGLIQWSVPSNLVYPRHYSAFRPEQIAPLVDFLEIHFYPLDSGAYTYQDTESEQRNLAYLEGVLREVAKAGKPVVIGEFGWYGGGKPRFDQGRHPAASEEQQARWCSNVVLKSEGLAVGWLNWGLYDQPEATDASEFTGLLKSDGRIKAWGREFQNLSTRMKARRIYQRTSIPDRPVLDWDRCVTSSAEGRSFRDAYYFAYKRSIPAR